MQTIDTDGLKPLGPGGVGPWRMGEDRLLHVLSGGRVIPTETAAREMLETYRAAAAAAGTPQGHEVVRLRGGFGVVVDYVRGVALALHVAVGSYSPAEAGEVMGGVLLRLHGAHMRAGRDLNGRFRSGAHELAPLLPTSLGSRLEALVGAVPDSDHLLHGDFHLGNVVMSDSRPVPVDMESTGFGHPAFDLAIGRARMIGNMAREAMRLGIDAQAAKRIVHEAWRGLLGEYFAGAAPAELAEIDRRLAVLAEIERFLQPCDVVGSGEGRGGRQSGGARRTEILSELLPGLDRLDFDLP